MRTLALDYGDKTIGVAVSDPLGILAVGVETIRRTDAVQLKKSLSRLRELIAHYTVSEILLGYPKNMNNSEGPRCEQTKVFKERLERSFQGIPVILWDERLSTVGAMRGMANLSYQKKHDLIDTMAAAYILQGYLDSKNQRKGVTRVALYDEEDELEDDAFEVITMRDEDGEDISFVVLDVKDYNGAKYLLVLEEEFMDDEDAEASIIKAVEDEDEDEVYAFIEDDDEFEAVAGLFRDGNEDFDIEY
jgi:putative Holliday junction resolvase